MKGLARRLKALACTAPLHDLDARKTRLDWVDASNYQMAEVALQVIDQVTIAMDFDRGAWHEQVVARVRPFVAAQTPDRSEDEHDRVIRWVLDNLINVGSVDRGFRAWYGTFGVAGAYERRAFDFKLLIELAGPDGEVYLRATDEAIIFWLARWTPTSNRRRSLRGQARQSDQGAGCRTPGWPPSRLGTGRCTTPRHCGVGAARAGRGGGDRLRRQPP